MKILLVIILLFGLGGCTQYRTLIATNGAKSADAALEAAEWGMCKLATGGALERRYHLFSDPGNPRAEGWVKVCPIGTLVK